MLSLSDSRISDFSAYQLYSLVIDVEKYPDFVPWCNESKILTSKDDIIEARLGIKFGIFSKSYISEIKHGVYKDNNYFININQKEGPFEYLKTNWDFIQQSEFKSLVTLKMEFEIKNKLIESVLGAIFDSTTNSMIEAFENRAKEIYGDSELSA